MPDLEPKQEKFQIQGWYVYKDNILWTDDYYCTLVLKFQPNLFSPLNLFSK